MEHIELIILYVAITMFVACCLFINTRQTGDKEARFFFSLYSKNFFRQVLFCLTMTIWYWVSIHIIFIVPVVVICLIIFFGGH